MLPGVRRIRAQVPRYAASWEEANALAAARPSGPLWVVLGDSTAQGIGAPTYEQGYVGQVHALLDERQRERSEEPWRVINLSRSGARAVHVLDEQLPRLEALDAEPDLVTCAIGANDLLRTPLDTLLQQMRRVIARLPSGAVIATLPQGLRPQRAILVNEMISAEAPAAGLRVADVWARTGPPWRGKFASDGFHPAARGYADWSAAFAEALGLPERAPPAGHVGRPDVQ